MTDVSNEVSVNIYFHSHFSDEYSQNKAYTFEHMKYCIHWMYKNNLFIKEGIIYDTIGGCIK